MKTRKNVILSFEDIDKAMLGEVGGKGANLGELHRIESVKVPEGFCVTAEAYNRIIGDNETLASLLEELAVLKAEDRKQIAEVGARIRKLIEETVIPEDLLQEIVRHLELRSEEKAYAVRSSATAEDLPTASFAGQQDSYLNIIGKASVLRHISKCWASLFTDRAIIYRLQNGFNHQRVSLSVVVQEMVFPDVSGILFTADPVSSNRRVSAIDASFGLGEALVSGLVNADHYTVREGRISGKSISTKKLAVYASKEGGTSRREIEPTHQNRQALKDEQILHLERIGRVIEAHFGNPQDIEWCLADGVFYVVQSRPITTLYPIPYRPGGPEVNHSETHVYLSVGHNQMMTDAMKPLGLSFWLLTTSAPMCVAGGRLFVDVTRQLGSPEGRKKLIEGFGKTDHLIKDALMTVAEREDLVKLLPDQETT